ncbi:hypothetical protein C8N24_6284 [Solirubrobacter pauli]|uniref:Uncharacterized protein n=1 Tax=Solirubrobacter pauli TaxID=166793 RepID=A0A660L5Z0_9ACTN|nr:hypothetical protein C8N24_6284 [Solirubrobacter pauli]
MVFTGLKIDRVRVGALETRSEKRVVRFEENAL